MTDTKDTKGTAVPIAEDPSPAIFQAIAGLHTLADTYSMPSSQRLTKLQEGITAILKKIDDLEKDASSCDKWKISKGKLLYWRGKTYDALPLYNEEAERCLSRAVKFEPSMIDAWNTLANCYWKKKDLASAKNCLTSAIQQKKNKESLCSLSMVLRNTPGDAKERMASLIESVKVAKDAIALDMKDGKCWYVLGNAFLTQFFNTGSDLSILQSALNAYKRAETCQVNCAANNPDLYYNRANVYKFYEDYQPALENYIRALQLDPSLPAQEEIENIKWFVTKLAKLVHAKAGLKAKKLQQLTSELANPDAKFMEKKHVMVADLKTGANDGVYVSNKVVAPVSKDSNVPVSFLMVDGAGTVTVLSLYNVIADVLDHVKVGDKVRILDPNLKRVELKEMKDCCYNCIQITNPNNFIVNGKKLASTAVAQPVAKIQAF